MLPRKMPAGYKPEKELWKNLGDLSGLEVLHNDV